VLLLLLLLLLLLPVLPHLLLVLLLLLRWTVIDRKTASCCRRLGKYPRQGRGLFSSWLVLLGRLLMMQMVIRIREEEEEEEEGCERSRSLAFLLRRNHPGT